MCIHHYLSLYFMWENSDLNTMKLIWILLLMPRSSTGLVEPAAAPSPPADLPPGTSNLFFKTTRADLPTKSPAPSSQCGLRQSLNMRQTFTNLCCRSDAKSDPLSIWLPLSWPLVVLEIAHVQFIVQTQQISIVSFHMFRLISSSINECFPLRWSAAWNHACSQSSASKWCWYYATVSDHWWAG